MRITGYLRGLQSHVATGQIATREYLETFEPKSLRRLKVFDTTPPDDLRRSFFDKLTANYSNPRSILKLYRKYISIDDYPSYPWLVRCLCQLGNSFSFNSFWSPSDRQALIQLPLFKYLIYDLIERKHYLHPRHAPRMIFALAALEYRSWPLLSELLRLVERHLQEWRLPTLCCMIGCLVQLGISNSNYPNGQAYKNIVDTLFNEVERRDPVDASMFDWALLSYSLVLTNRYEWPSCENAVLPIYLARVCEKLNLETLAISGWVQYMLYLIIYCTDVEQPKNELKIKKSVPFKFQESLHTRWLNEILIHAQNQGTEWLQKDVDSVMEGLGINEALINCSVGREEDEQHCLFCGHLFPNRRLCLEYNYLMPAPDGEPIESGLISFRRRLFNRFGYGVAVIHKHQWDRLATNEKEEQIVRILSDFPIIEGQTYETCPKAKEFEDSKIKHMKHLRPKVTTWPPNKVTL